jgi:DNA transposition AAA+ family ATPase
MPQVLRLITATEGYIGRLDEVLREAAIASLSQGHKKVNYTILKEIARVYS